MKRFGSKIGMFVVAASALAIALGAGPAYASAGTAAVAGSGRILPGLTTTPTAQSLVTFTGTAVVAGTSGSGDYNCSFSGSSNGFLETVLVGNGSVTGTCSGTVPVAQSFNCSVSYHRNVNVVTLAGSCTGSVTGTLAAAGCVFEPTSNPVTSYELQCDVTI
ncbi:MAG: hypothetical protein ACYDAQ_11030 [Mycobacteriales bacterium]